MEKYNVELLGTSVESIKNGEDRERFRNLMLKIDEPIPDSSIIHSYEEGVQFVKEIGYPVIIRPAYTLGGDGGGFAYNDSELEAVLKKGLRQALFIRCWWKEALKAGKKLSMKLCEMQMIHVLSFVIWRIWIP